MEKHSTDLEDVIAAPTIPYDGTGASSLEDYEDEKHISLKREEGQATTMEVKEAEQMYDIEAADVTA